MDKDANINLRLDKEWKERAGRVAKTCGSNTSLVLRMLLERFVEHAEAHGGKVVLPLEFKLRKFPRTKSCIHNSGR